MTRKSGRILCIAVLLVTIIAAVILVATGSAKPELLLTILGIIAGIVVIVFQLAEQQDASLELQRENARQELRLRVYEQLKAKASIAYARSRTVRWYAHSIVSQLELYIGGVEYGMPPWNIEERAEEFLHLSSMANQALVELIAEIEQWEISFTSADLFRIAFSSASRDIENAFQPFFQEAIRLLPVDKRPPEQGTFSQPPVARSRFDEMKRLAIPYIEARDEFHCYIQDLVVEAQNQLLSTLFEHRVAIRKPLDVRHKVITESQRQDLQVYFQKDTALGTANTEATAHVLTELSKSDPE